MKHDWLKPLLLDFIQQKLCIAEKETTWRCRKPICTAWGLFSLSPRILPCRKESTPTSSRKGSSFKETAGNNELEILQNPRNTLWPSLRSPGCGVWGLEKPVRLEIREWGLEFGDQRIQWTTRLQAVSFSLLSRQACAPTSKLSPLFPCSSLWLFSTALVDFWLAPHFSSLIFHSIFHSILLGVRTSSQPMYLLGTFHCYLYHLCFYPHLHVYQKLKLPNFPIPDGLRLCILGYLAGRWPD